MRRHHVKYRNTIKEGEEEEEAYTTITLSYSQNPKNKPGYSSWGYNPKLVN